MSMQDRLLHEKAKEQELKERVRLAKEALKNSPRATFTSTGCDQNAGRITPAIRYECTFAVWFSGRAGSFGQSRRAKRSTKGEMQVRRRIVTKVLFEHGNSTANEILPFCQWNFIVRFENSSFKKCLKKFIADFVKGEEHGVWCLTDSARVRYMSEGSDQFSEGFFEFINPNWSPLLKGRRTPICISVVKRSCITIEAPSSR